MTAATLDVQLEREVDIRKAIDFLKKMLDCNIVNEKNPKRLENMIIYYYWLGKMVAQSLEAAYQVGCRGVVPERHDAPRTAYSYQITRIAGICPSEQKYAEIIEGLRKLQ